MRRLRVLVAVLACLATSATAQSVADSAVLLPVNRFFEGMRTRDTALIRSTITSDATLLSAGGPSGIGERITGNDFIRAVGAAKGDAWNERIFDPIVRVDGPFASVWARYTFLLGDKFLHCGVDAIQLVDVGGAWKVRHLSDSRRTTGCPDAASQDDAPAALAVATAMLAGLTAKDTLAIRETIDSGIVLLVAGGPTGVRARTNGAEFQRQIATAADRLDERMMEPEVRVDGPLAEVWGPYRFMINGTFSHCGADGFHLVKGATGWKVAQLMYSTRREGCGTLKP